MESGSQEPKVSVEEPCLILKQIEKLRYEMNCLAEDHGLTSGVLIDASQRLDDLLNRYEQNRKEVQIC